jgi:8-oxo-dGTP diphosphatase
VKNIIRTVGCFLQLEDKFLILNRHPEDSWGNKYGLVAGGIEEGESEEEAILREIKEETGYSAEKEELEYLGEWTWDFSERTITFVTFKVSLNEPINVVLQPGEHTHFEWVSAEECKNREDLVPGFHDLLEYIRNK